MGVVSMESGQGRKNFHARCARNYIFCPPNLQHLPTPMISADIIELVDSISRDGLDMYI